MILNTEHLKAPFRSLKSLNYMQESEPLFLAREPYIYYNQREMGLLLGRDPCTQVNGLFGSAPDGSVLFL